MSDPVNDPISDEEISKWDSWSDYKLRRERTRLQREIDNVDTFKEENEETMGKALLQMRMVCSIDTALYRRTVRRFNRSQEPRCACGADDCDHYPHTPITSE